MPAPAPPAPGTAVDTARPSTRVGPTSPKVALCDRRAGRSADGATTRAGASGLGNNIGPGTYGKPVSRGRQECVSRLGIRMRTRLADDADEFRVDLGSGG